MTATKGPAPSAEDALRESNEHFEANREAFIKDHYETFVLIIGRSTEGFFKDRGSAYFHAMMQFPDEPVVLIRQWHTRG